MDGKTFSASLPGSDQTLGISSWSLAVHSLQSREVDQTGVDVNLADDVARGRIGNHNLLRGREGKSDQEQAEEEKTAWSLSEITKNGCVIEVIGGKSECLTFKWTKGLTSEKV